MFEVALTSMTPTVHGASGSLLTVFKPLVHTSHLTESYV